MPTTPLRLVPKLHESESQRRIRESLHDMKDALRAALGSARIVGTNPASIALKVWRERRGAWSAEASTATRIGAMLAPQFHKLARLLVTREVPDGHVPIVYVDFVHRDLGVASVWVDETRTIDGRLGLMFSRALPEVRRVLRAASPADMQGSCLVVTDCGCAHLMTTTKLLSAQDEQARATMAEFVAEPTHGNLRVACNHEGYIRTWHAPVADLLDRDTN